MAVSEVTMYRASDGRVFATTREAWAHEARLELINLIGHIDLDALMDHGEIVDCLISERAYVIRHLTAIGE